MFAPIRNILIFTTLVITVTACSTMNKSECLTADWRTIGYGDGARGYKAARISEHRSACAEHGIRPDLNAYNSGREEGLNKHCTPTTGYNKGLSGYQYNGVCSGHNEQNFVEALNFGLAVYSEVRTLNNLKSNYAKQQRYIQQLEDELHLKEDQIVSGKLSKVKAVIILNETKEIAEELGKAKSDLNNMNYDINNQSQRVADIKNQRRYN